MKVGLIPGTAGTFPCDGASVTALSRATEASGFDSIWLGEHVVLPAYPNEPYPGSKEGLPGPSSGQLPDPLDWLSFAAACTETLLVGTAIVILPLHNPLIMAKRLATIDQLSGGRLRLGVGVGWNRQELDAVGVPWTVRGRFMEESIAAMRTMWREEIATFSGEFVRFEPIYSSPKPTNGFVPIFVGGSADAAAERAGRIGDAFLPFERDFDRLAELIAIMRRSAEVAGRNPDSIPVTTLGSIRPERMARLIELGVERMLLFTTGFDVAAVSELGGHCQEALSSL